MTQRDCVGKVVGSAPLLLTVPSGAYSSSRGTPDDRFEGGGGGEASVNLSAHSHVLRGLREPVVEGRLGGPQLVEEDVAMRKVLTLAGGLAFAALYSAELQKHLSFLICTRSRNYLRPGQ